MGVFITSFLDKQISIPEDLKEYLKILEFTLDSDRELFDSFSKSVLKTERKAIEEEELIALLKNTSEKYLKKLCEKGIYSITISDLLSNVPGYSEVISENKNALQATWDFLREEALGFIDGVSGAENAALSKVTGSGVSVWSSSFTTLASFAALDYFTAKKQLREANNEYKEEIKALSKRGKNERERKTINYVKKIYFPNMERALSVFSFGLMDKYIRTLIDNNLFDGKALDYVDIKKSDELLQNIQYSSDIKSVLISAFETCPFNINVFDECAISGLFSSEMLSFLQWLGKNNEFVIRVRSKFTSLTTEANETSNDEKAFLEVVDEAKGIVSALSVLTGDPETVYYKQMGQSIFDRVFSDYSFFSNCLLNKETCMEWYSDKKPGDVLSYSEEDVKNKVAEQIQSIASEKLTDTLLNICGYRSSFSELFPQNSVSDEWNKKEFDGYFTEKCPDLIAKMLPDAKKTTKDLIRKAEEQKNKKLEEIKKYNRKNKFKKILLAFGLILIFILPMVSHWWNTAIRLSAIEDEIRSELGRGLRTELNKIDSYTNRISLKNSFEIKSIDYYKNFSLDIACIVPTVEFYSNKMYLDDQTASWAIRELEGYLYRLKVERYSAYRYNITIKSSSGATLYSTSYSEASLKKDGMERTYPYLFSGWEVFGLIVYGIILFAVYKKIVHKKLIYKKI